MSRALDEETAASLASGDPGKAYREISALFVTAGPREPLEIEILGHLPEDEGSGGGSRTVLLRDGAAVAIAKKSLVMAFFVARKVLQGALQNRKGPFGEEGEGKQTTTLAAATAVLLLLDPEHLTAANTRKRLLRDTKDEALLADELVFVDSLLTSHLHRHTKSPTLWSHRRWLVAQRATRPGADVRKEMAAVVLVAAVRHPRNYYAWDHARWLVARNRHDGDAGTTTADNGDNGDNDQAEELLVADVRAWCFQHHTDTSGWSFLLYLLGRNTTATTVRYNQQRLLLRDTLAQVEQRAVSLRWTGEAVWVFLRTATAVLAETDGGGGGSSEEGDTRFRETAVALQGRLDPASHDYHVLQQAQDWRLAYGKLHERAPSSG